MSLADQKAEDLVRELGSRGLASFTKEKLEAFAQRALQHGVEEGLNVFRLHLSHPAAEGETAPPRVFDPRKHCSVCKRSIERMVERLKAQEKDARAARPGDLLVPGLALPGSLDGKTVALDAGGVLRILDGGTG